jgi:GntR family transcriptional regulator/MocR family aminotransferase
MRRVYRGRLEALATALRRQLGGFLTFREPCGGTAIWVHTRSARAMNQWARAARAGGVAFDAASSFTLAGTRLAAARLGFACLNEAEIARAVHALSEAAARTAP